jgi:DNA-binding GntR family transcriptional regulator
MCAADMAVIDPLGNPQYTYLQVAAVIAARIRSGEISHQLPSYQTVRHAISVLRDNGTVITRHGRGNFVRSLGPPDSPAYR